VPAPLAPPTHAPPPPAQPARTLEQEHDTLAAEKRLLAEAAAALAREDRGAALRSIAAHAARFPRGQLAGVRERLRGRALARPETSATPRAQEAR